MPNDDSKQNGKQEIPQEQQSMTTDEIVEADYEVLSPSDSDRSQQPEGGDRIEERGGFALSPPGRTPNDDSIEASSNDPGGTPDGKKFSAGYESQMATRIGEEDSDDDADHLRELHEGRHRSDGEHSVRESQRDKKRIAQGICSSLPFARHEQRDVVSLVEQLDLTRFGNQRSIPRVVLGAVIVVVDEHHRQSREDAEEFVTWSDEFRTLCAENGVKMSDLNTIKEKVREGIQSKGATLGPTNPRRDTSLSGPTSPRNLPDEYWDNIPAERWTVMAKRWENVPDEKKEAIPTEHRERVELLRRWEPWPDHDTNEGENNTSRSEPSAEIDEEELAKEVEALVEEMEADREVDSK